MNNTLIKKSRPLQALIERNRKSRIDPDLPIMQIPIDAETVLSILPGDRHAFMAGTIVEAAGRKAIPEEHIARAARILHTEHTNNFSGRIHDIIIGFATLVITDWHSPRWMKRFYEDLERDTEGTVKRYCNDAFAMLLIDNLRREVVIDLTNPSLDTRAQFLRAIHAAREQLGDLLRLRRPLSSIFWLEVATVAREHGCDLRLPARDKSRGGAARTPLFDFAELMRTLLVERGRMLLPHYPAEVQVHARDRFGRIEALRQSSVISNLEEAKKEIRKQDQ